MAAVLTAASILVCPHNFPFTVLPSQHQFTVDGQFLLLGADLLATVITTCTNPPPTKCTKILSVTAGLSTTLRIGAEQVVLATALGSTNISPPPPPGSDKAPGWHVQLANQDKLEAE